MGSPPQMETIGAPQSSSAARHCSTVSVSLIVDLYSRIRPQPVHVILQPCSGSSIITKGNFFSRRIAFPARYPVKLAVILSGNLIQPPDLTCGAGNLQARAGKR